MFFTLTVRRLVGNPAVPMPKVYGARPDLETGRRMLAVATEGGIVLTVSGPPPARGPSPAVSGPVFRSTVHAPLR